MHRISVAVLAGGKSRRLGQNKAFVQLGRRLVVERVLDVVTTLSNDVLIVTDDLVNYRGLGQRLVTDAYPGCASLGGIYSGLWAARHEQMLVVGCDMPFLNVALLEYMVALSGHHDVVMPSYDSYIEPLHAIYHKRCLPVMARLIQAGNLRIAEVFDAVTPRLVTARELDIFDPHKLSFFNINTPQDLAKAEALADLRRRGWER